MYFSSSSYVDDFRTLELEAEGATPETLRKAYVRLARRFHPDNVANVDDPQKFRDINDAYERLKRKFAEDEKRAVFEQEQDEEHPDIK